MKSYIAAGALLAALASAQSISDLPSCSLSCILTGVQTVGCSATDFTCSCDKADQLSASVTPCVQKACSAADQAKVVSVLEGICKSVGVTISINTGGVATSSPPAASSSAPAAASSSAAASAPAGSSSAAPASYSSAAAASTVCSASTTYTTVTVSPSHGSSPSYGTNGTVTTAAPTAYTGAASSNGVVFGAAGLFGLLAYVL